MINNKYIKNWEKNCFSAFYVIIYVLNDIMHGILQNGLYECYKWCFENGICDEFKFCGVLLMSTHSCVFSPY